MNWNRHRGRLWSLKRLVLLTDKLSVCRLGLKKHASDRDQPQISYARYSSTINSIIRGSNINSIELLDFQRDEK